MSQEVFKVPKTKRPQPAKHDQQAGKSWSPIKRRRTKDDFFTFCQIVLEYTGYESLKSEELRLHNNTSPLDSGGSAAESFTSDSSLGSWCNDPEDERRVDFPSRANVRHGGMVQRLKHSSIKNSMKNRHRPHVATKVIIADSHGTMMTPPNVTPLSPPSDGSGSLSPTGSNSSVDPSLMSSEDKGDSFELVTCYCMKPFAGRPMIECSECLTWVHLSCAKIRRTNIPEEFTCTRCKENKFTTRKSGRVRLEKRPSTP